MPVIALANAKGGAGKTTAALILATELARQGNRVVILDADPQRWITSWHEASGAIKNIEVISEVTQSSLQCHLRELRDVTDYFVIDLAGARDAIVSTALALADHVLIPVQGCAMDARGAAQILDLLHLMAERGIRKVPHSVVLTRVSSMVTTRAMLAIKALLAERGVNVFDTAIIERAAFREIFEFGGTLQTMDPARVSNLDRARDNARALADELPRLLPARVVQSSGPRNLFRLKQAA